MKKLLLVLFSFITLFAYSQDEVQIGNQIWMNKNLNVGTMIPNTQAQSNNDIIEKYCYNNDPAMCEVYGGFYQWNEAMQYSNVPGTQGLCPNGFHVPTYEEWMELISYCGGTDIAGARLKEVGLTHWAPPSAYKPYADMWYTKLHPATWKPDDAFGFALLGNGYVVPGRNGNLNKVSYNWSSTMLRGDYFVGSPTDAVLRPVQVTASYSYPWMNPATIYDFAADAIRCIKN